MKFHALLGVVGLSLVACATGTEPTLILDPLTGGGQAGIDAAAGSGAMAGGGAAGTESGGVAGSSTAGMAGLGGGAGGGGAGGTAGGGAGGGGAGGGMAGTAGSGGVPNQPEPKSITVSGTKNVTPRQAPSTGGTQYTDDCPANQVLIGFRSTIDGGLAGLRSVQGICGTLAVGPDSPFPITTTQAGMLTAREATGNTIENAMCPANQVIIGFSGRAGTYIEALIFRCAPLTVSGNAPSYQLTIGNATNTSPVGGENAGTTFNAINCAAGEVAVSQAPKAGSAIDSFGLRCAATSLVVQ